VFGAIHANTVLSAKTSRYRLLVCFPFRLLTVGT